MKNVQNTLFAEIKNKSNTVKGENKKDLFKKIKKVADKYPNAICYYVQINSPVSINRKWSLSYEDDGEIIKLSHNRIFEISADKFYEILTGDPKAFFKLCTIIPTVITKLKLEDFQDYSPVVYKELYNKSLLNKNTILEQLFLDSFSSYEGFKDMLKD